MKKLAAIILVAVFALSTTTVNAQLISPADEPFEVVPMPSMDTYPTYFGYGDYSDALAWAFENDVMTGYEDGSLGETECVKRVELLKMLFKVLEVDETKATSELFPDTPEGEWYVDFVRTARDKNTVQGYEDGTFKPAQCVNRAEAIKMAILEFNNGRVPGYFTEYTGVDDVTADQWFYEHVMYALSENAVGLNHTNYSYYPDYYYYPGDSMTREEVAEMLYRLKTMQDRGLVTYAEVYEPDDLLLVPLETRDVELEEFFAKDASMLISVDTNSSAQTATFNNLLSMFPSGDLDEVVELFFEEMSANFAAQGLSYDSDVQPIFGNQYRAVLGISDSMSDSMMGSPDMHFAITVADSEKLENFSSVLAELDDYREANILGFKTLTNENELVYLTFTNNALLLSQTKGDRYAALQRLKNAEPTLLDNDEYVGYTKSLPTPNLGMMYLNFQNLYGGNEFGLGNPFGQGMNSEAIAFAAQRDGLNLYVQAAGYEMPQHEPYMYKNLPGDDLIMYAEAYGLVDSIDATGSMLMEGLEDEGVMLTEGDWMNAGYAFVVQHNDSMIPGMTMYFDASDDVAGGKAAIEDFDELIAMFYDEMINDPYSEIDFSDIITKDTVRIDGGTFHKFTIDATGLSEAEAYEVGMDSPFFSKPFNLYYGMNSDDYVVFSTYNNLPAELGGFSTVARHDEVKESMEYVEDYPYGYSYISVTETVTYVDMLIEMLEEEEGPMPADAREVYDTVKEYLAPIKYMAAGDEDYVDGVGGLLFLRIDR